MRKSRINWERHKRSAKMDKLIRKLGKKHKHLTVYNNKVVTKPREIPQMSTIQK